MKLEKLKQLKEQYKSKIIDGTKIARAIKEELKIKTAELMKNSRIQPGLAVVLVGENPASMVYVKSKQKASEEIGYLSRILRLPDGVSERELLSTVEALNADNSIHGILVQLPIPPHINDKKILYAISPDKDVDGFHPYNVGKMLIDDAKFLPCTPSGIMELLKRSNVETSGKEVVVLGRSLIVGKPMANLLLQKGVDATVTVAHSRTQNIAGLLKKTDIIVAAIGRPKFVTRDMVKEGAVIIDVGMNRDTDGTLCGDVDFEGVLPMVSRITPVPGGVGPMTIAMLAKNTFLAASAKTKSKSV